MKESEIRIEAKTRRWAKIQVGDVPAFFATLAALAYFAFFPVGANFVFLPRTQLKPKARD